MITSIHTLIYSDDAPATRAFLRDVLGWPCVEDAQGGGEGWLIFKSGPSELGVHPTRSVHGGKTYESPRHHLLSLMCDDISSTVAELKSKGAQFRGEVQDHGYGLVIMLAVPGGAEKGSGCESGNPTVWRVVWWGWSRGQLLRDI